jgi:hypothetical protein
VRGIARRRGDLVIGQHDVLAVGPFVSADDLRAWNLAVLLGADPALLQPLAVGGVDLVEVDRAVLGRGIALTVTGVRPSEIVPFQIDRGASLHYPLRQFVIAIASRTHTAQL